MECDTPLESCQRELQICFRPHPNRRSEQRIIIPQNVGSPNQDNAKIKSHLDLGAAKRRKEYYMGEGGGFPQVRAVVSLVSPELPVAHPNTKGAPENELTNLLVGWMQI